MIKRGLGLFAMLVLLALPLSSATAQGPVGGPPPLPERLPPGEHDERGPEARALGLPETAGRAETAHPNSLYWQIERVDAPKAFSNMGQRSLALDASGHPHIAYGQDHLYYAWHDGGTWHREVADLSWGVGSYTSLALDANSHPHISYYDETNADLKYAHFDGASWLTEMVDSAGRVGRYTSLALDANSHPHISYYDEINYDLKYAHFDGSVWISETVDSAGSVGHFTSLALDTSGQPHISYYGYTNNDLKYAWWGECAPVAGVSIAGPAMLPVGQPGFYTATYTPPTATRPITFTWDNGTMGNTAAYSWTVPGTHTIAVTAANDCSGPITDTFDVLIVSCEPVQIVTVTTEISGCVVTFGASLLGDPPFVYAWDFGAFGSSDQPTPTMAFGTDGTYPYTLTVSNCQGAYSGTLAGQVTVSCPICEPVHDAAFSWVPFIPAVGQVITFTGSAAGTEPITYTWDLGDGTMAASQVVAHTYAATGTYRVVMTATNECGGEVVSHTMTVVLTPTCTPVKVGTVTTEISDCVVGFGADLLGDPPLTYLWTFGDGVTDTAAMPTHDYGTSGTYSGTLEVWNCAGNGYAEQPFVVTVDCAPPGGYRIFLPLVLSRVGGLVLWNY